MKVVLTQACYASPLGHSACEVIERLRQGSSGIVDLSQHFAAHPVPVLTTGALTQPTTEESPTEPLHPRLSPRYQKVLAGFCGQVRELVASGQPPDRVYLIAKRPFYSKWYDAATREYCEWDFVEGLLRRCGLGPDAVSMQAACSTGILALNQAARAILRGDCQRVVVLAVQTELNPEKFLPFKKLGALSSEVDPARACRPFCRGRSGLVPGEIAVAVSLEGRSQRDLKSGQICLLPGITTSDAASLTDGRQDGVQLEHCLRRCLGDFSVEELDMLCPHGTSTPLNDEIEGKVLSRILGARSRPLAVAALKQYVGHTLVSSGLWETVLCAELMRHNLCPPHLSYHDLEDWPGLGFARSAQSLEVSRLLKVSVGFGGINSALILEKA